MNFIHHSDEESDEINAYHEAGHAFMAIYVGARVHCVTLEPSWDDGPERYADIEVHWPFEQFNARELQTNAILVALAGPVAEMIYRGDRFHPGLVAEWSADWKVAWSSAEALIREEKSRLRFLEQTTLELHRSMNLAEQWAAVAEIADQLLAHDTIDGETVETIVRQWLG